MIRSEKLPLNLIWIIPAKGHASTLPPSLNCGADLLKYWLFVSTRWRTAKPVPRVICRSPILPFSSMWTEYCFGMCQVSVPFHQHSCRVTLPRSWVISSSLSGVSQAQRWDLLVPHHLPVLPNPYPNDTIQGYVHQVHIPTWNTRSYRINVKMLNYNGWGNRY